MAEKFKVLYILDIFPSISETFVLNEILEMQKKGIIVEIFAFSRQVIEKVHDGTNKIKRIYYAKKNLILLVRGHFYWIFKNPIKYMEIALLSLRPSYSLLKVFFLNLGDLILLEKIKPDHIHAHFGRRSSNFALLAHLFLSIPYTFTTHRSDIFDKAPLNYKIKSQLAKKHITISKYNKDYLIDKFHVREMDISIVHCGIDFDNPIIRSIHEKNNSNVIVTVARLEKQKRLDILLNAYSLLKKDGVDYRAKIIGYGSKYIELTKTIKRLSLEDRVELVGSKTQDEVFSILKLAKIFVLSSESEGIPVVLMEALACGIPVIAPDIMGIPELINDGETGFLFPSGDFFELTKKIKILFKNSYQVKKISEKGYQKVYNEFSLQQETEKLLNIWKC